MSRSERSKNFSRWALPLVGGVTAYGLSQAAFSRKIRQESARRDRYCQLDGCQSTDMVVHHIIPESIANGKEAYHPGADLYVDILRSTWQQIYSHLQNNDRQLAKKVKKKLRKFIKSSDNSLTLCSHHHQGLHHGDFSYHQPIQPNGKFRPNSFHYQDLQTFLFFTLIDIHPPLNDSLNFKKIAQAGFQDAISHYH